NKVMKNQKGFTLVEVLVAGGIMTVMGLALVGSLVTSMKTQRSMALTDDLQNAVFLTRMNLLRPNVCKANLGNFSGLTFNSANLTIVKFSISKLVNPSNPTKPILVSNDKLGNKEGTLLTLTLDNFQPVVPNVAYTAELNFALDKGSGMGAININRKLPLMLTTTGNGNLTIVDCSVDGQAGAVASPITSIGVGTKSPIAWAVISRPTPEYLSIPPCTETPAFCTPVGSRCKLVGHPSIHPENDKLDTLYTCMYQGMMDGPGGEQGGGDGSGSSGSGAGGSGD
ncbi:MAG: type II secretion system protein, partial [Proteobacteria bacterium]